jgi:hypothetical protein
MLAGAALADAPKGKKPAGEKGPDMAAMMAAMEKAATPGEQHKQLAKMVGSWDVSIKSWMEPGKPPMENKGTAEIKSILDGRFTQMNVTSTMMGKPFNGMGIDGYDNVKKKFVGAWVDSMSTAICTSEGTADAKGMTSKMICSDPMTGKDEVMTIAMKWEGDKKFVEEFSRKMPDGKEMKMMELTYVKK